MASKVKVVFFRDNESFSDAQHRVVVAILKEIGDGNLCRLKAVIMEKDIASKQQILLAAFSMETIRRSTRKQQSNTSKKISSQSLESDVPKKEVKSERKSRSRKRKRFSDEDEEFCIKTTKTPSRASSSRSSTQVPDSSSTENPVPLAECKKENDVLFSWHGIEITQAALDSLQDGQNIDRSIMDGFIRKLKEEDKIERECFSILTTKTWTSILRGQFMPKVVNDLSEELNLEYLRNYGKLVMLMPAYFEENEAWSLLHIILNRVRFLDAIYYLPPEKKLEIDFRNEHEGKVKHFLMELFDTTGEIRRMSRIRMGMATPDKKITSVDYGVLIMKLLENAVFNREGPVNFEDVQKLREQLRDDLARKLEETRYQLGDVRYLYKENEIYYCGEKKVITGKDLNSLKENATPTGNIMNYFIDLMKWRQGGGIIKSVIDEQMILNQNFRRIHRNFSLTKFGYLRYNPCRIFVPVKLQSPDDTPVWCLFELFEDPLSKVSYFTPCFVGDEAHYNASIKSLMKKVKILIQMEPFTEFGEFEILDPEFETGFDLNNDFDTGICLLSLCDQRLMNLSSEYMSYDDDPHPRHNMAELRQFVFDRIWKTVSNCKEITIDDSDSDFSC